MEALKRYLRKVALLIRPINVGDKFIDNPEKLLKKSTLKKFEGRLLGGDDGVLLGFYIEENSTYANMYADLGLKFSRPNGTEAKTHQGFGFKISKDQLKKDYIDGKITRISFDKFRSIYQSRLGN